MVNKMVNNGQSWLIMVNNMVNRNHLKAGKNQR